ncbi:Flagellar biosynthesis protein FlhB [Dissulfuribacter thermophilus]|uniref:Flagellar biosynthesis protein FlhB n=1 Tax=Dissulfuribacter thermophilus TaxID=1156395 RepID=A0A1B9F6M0_9BACT|nr:EscU/YscU/HrcU family type III secretion system export apparatus switch protein [Dissulfuribacter thermophilus]OCC15550.1 Flagellar biosynthesis protein FlhB [Dissulfuribacter thermophilus]
MKRSMRKKAVALKYDPSIDKAPKVVAKGAGKIAEQILEIAQRSGVPIREDSDLVEVLSHLDIHQEIPPETYIVVAEILAWVYRLNAEKV